MLKGQTSSGLTPTDSIGRPQVATLAPAASLISFKSVGKSFKTNNAVVEAVRDVSLNVNAGEFITLVGPSGCGKSTLLNMIAGIMKPSEGTVEYGGAPVSAINCRVGYMTQHDHLLPWKTIAANIAVPLKIKGAGRLEIATRVSELIKLVGLTGFGDYYPSQVSGGMRKRTALARLLASDAETFLMDEPFGALDAQLRVALQSELLAIRSRFAKTVIFVTHDLDEAIALADKTVVFSGRPGRIIRILETGLPRERDLFRLRFDTNFLERARELWEILSPDLKSAEIRQ